MVIQLFSSMIKVEFYSRPWSGEPIYRNGEYCGFVTSAAYGFTLGKQVNIIQRRNLSFFYD
jgi:glycine cleavage system aminomethyltransferase T